MFACKNTLLCKCLNKISPLTLPFLYPPSLARLPAISHRHQPLWWSAPCVLMLEVYDRLESNTSSLAVTSSKLGNCGHNEWSRVFCYPCMDGPVHTVLPKSLWGDCTDLYLPLEKEHFLTEILVFLQGHWSFYVNNVLYIHNGRGERYLSQLVTATNTQIWEKSKQPCDRDV